MSLAVSRLEELLAAALLTDTSVLLTVAPGALSLVITQPGALAPLRAEFRLPSLARAPIDLLVDRLAAKRAQQLRMPEIARQLEASAGGLLLDQLKVLDDLEIPRPMVEVVARELRDSILRQLDEKL